MVDANRQREHILPSEKAFAYKMRDDALKHLRAGQVVPPVGRTTEQIGKENDESDRNVRRMIRLTKLIPPLLDMVDRGKLGTTTAVELSYLSKKEQEAVQTAIESEQSIPSQTQAKMLRRLHDEDGVGAGRGHLGREDGFAPGGRQDDERRLTAFLPEELDSLPDGFLLVWSQREHRRVSLRIWCDSACRCGHGPPS